MQLVDVNLYTYMMCWILMYACMYVCMYGCMCVCMYICMKYVNSNDLLEHVPEIILFFKAANIWNMFIAIACKVMLGAGASGQGSEGNGYGYVLF